MDIAQITLPCGHRPKIKNHGTAGGSKPYCRCLFCRKRLLLLHLPKPSWARAIRLKCASKYPIAVKSCNGTMRLRTLPPHLRKSCPTGPAPGRRLCRFASSLQNPEFRALFPEGFIHGAAPKHIHGSGEAAAGDFWGFKAVKHSVKRGFL